DPKIVHYNLFFKPWHFADVQYGQYFWDVAKKSPYYQELKDQLASFTDEDRKKARADLDWMIKKVDEIKDEDVTWAKVKKTTSVKI
ncbi:MAG: glycosyltransferase family 8 protein, partial [Lactobacillus sp.]|nr:glycosyltransferase family 8 protein [Lactobacillus sp.]